MSEYRNRIYRVRGTPFEIGYALGQALGPRLEANIARWVRERVTDPAAFDAERWRAGALPWLRTLPARFREEFEGLSEGAHLALQRVAEWAYIEVVLSGCCSGAIVRLGQRLWVARNNEFYAPGMWGYATIREVAGRIPAITFGLEADVFTPTGINQARLWLHQNGLRAWDAPLADRPHLPGYVWMVEALETCRTLQELEALLGRIQRDEGMLLFAVDGKSDACALYECSCTGYYRREPVQGWLVATNHALAHPQAQSPDDADPLSSTRRYARLAALVGDLAARPAEGSPVGALVRILADDGIEAREGEFVTGCSNVACPSTGELWYTFGGYPAASRGNWQRLEWAWPS